MWLVAWRQDASVQTISSSAVRVACSVAVASRLVVGSASFMRRTLALLAHGGKPPKHGSPIWRSSDAECHEGVVIRALPAPLGGTFWRWLATARPALYSSPHAA